jgi:AcrR family transcriptional regulator
MPDGEREKLRKGERTRLRLKKTALKLFAQRGIENVSIRDIQAAAGQKNNGSITYYFSSRDALIREIVTDVAKILDNDNNRRLDALEARGGPTSVREVAEILLPVVEREPEEVEVWENQLQFFTSVLITRRDLLFEATVDADRATRRCFKHIVRLAPDMPREIINQRLQLMLLFALSAGASMESGKEGHRNWSSLWGQSSAEHNLADIMAGMIMAPVSQETLSRVGKKKTLPIPAEKN